MKITEGADIYLDANFLVAYFIPIRNGDRINQKAKIAMAKMLSKNCTLYLSPLVFDEFWNGIKKEAGIKNIRNKVRFYFDKFIRNQTPFSGLKNRGTDYYGHFELHSQLEKYTNSLRAKSNVEVISYDKPIEGVKDALNNIKKHQMKPRDSFHLSLLREKNISFILTRDSSFLSLEDEENIDGINFMDF